MKKKINTLNDAIVQVANWLDILNMDSSYNNNLDEFQSKCYKEMAEEMDEWDPTFRVDVMIRLTEKGKLCPKQELKDRTKHC